MMDAFVESLREVLSLTAWEMEVPEPYGPLHLISMLAGFPLAVFVAYKLRGLGERGNRAVLLSVGVFLLISEIYKQLMYEVVLEPGGGYRWGIFPFQLCSIPMYFCLIVPFLKPGRLRQAMYDFMMTYNLLGGFVAFLEPSGLLHGHWTLTMHALIWHLILVFVGVYVALSGRGGVEKKDYRLATVTFCALAVVAFCINCAFYGISNHQLKMFFVGPAHSPIIIFEDISKNFGWFVSTALYIPTVCLGAFIIFCLFRFLRRRYSR